MSTELKPCPFCGGKPEIERRGTQSASMVIACTECGGRMESGDVCGLTDPEHWHWNMRAVEADTARLQTELAAKLHIAAQERLGELLPPMDGEDVVVQLKLIKGEK